jgi:DNA-directed RNA polymerase subunit K/omega
MIQTVPEGIDSKFRYVLLIARRAEQLLRGARPKFDLPRPMKPTRLAEREFDDGMIRWGYGPEGGILDTETEETSAAPEDLVEGEIQE